jgi:hypothetical protein
MKNLFILGSPRKNGNSVTMAKAVAEGILETSGNSIEYIYLNDLNIRPCQGCGGCNKTGECVIKDDMQALYTKTRSADRLFLVSPIYFYSLTAQLKGYIDRCQALWARKYLIKHYKTIDPHRTGYLLSCAATKGDKLFDSPILIVKCLCDTLNIQFGSPLLLRNLENVDALRTMPNEIAYCRNFGEKLSNTGDER